MRWQSGRRSDNVEDRRGMRVGPPVMIGGGGLLVLMLVAVLCGVDPSALLQVLGTESGGPLSQQVDEPRGGDAEATVPDEASDFVRVVLASTEDTWSEVFRKQGRNYEEPHLALFTDATDSGCGFASATMGPFYCPQDRKVYIDLGFYRELRDRFGAPGDFAQAYVIAHEVGHHVQNLLGISDEVHSAQAQVDREGGNALSVKLELEADCFAGVWAHHADSQRPLLESGDIEEGINAAAAIGDDRLQRMSRGRVSPESFTHGSSQQRVHWFRTGLESGKMENCDTFSSRSK